MNTPPFLRRLLRVSKAYRLLQNRCNVDNPPILWEDVARLGGSSWKKKDLHAIYVG
jgi:hypothetical protein